MISCTPHHIERGGSEQYLYSREEELVMFSTHLARPVGIRNSWEIWIFYCTSGMNNRITSMAASSDVAAPISTKMFIAPGTYAAVSLQRISHHWVYAETENSDTERKISKCILLYLGKRMKEQRSCVTSARISERKIFTQRHKPAAPIRKERASATRGVWRRGFGCTGRSFL